MKIIDFQGLDHVPPLGGDAGNQENQRKSHEIIENLSIPAFRRMGEYMIQTLKSIIFIEMHDNLNIWIKKWSQFMF